MSLSGLAEYGPSGTRILAELGLGWGAWFAGGYGLLWDWPGRSEASEAPRPLRTALIRTALWSALLVSLTLVYLATRAEGPGFRMLALICTGLLALKVLVGFEERRGGLRAPTFVQWLGFCSWPGMRLHLFVEPGSTTSEHGAGALVQRGLIRLGLGALFLLGAWASARFLDSKLLASLAFLIGFSLTIHFGLCTILAGVLQTRGVPAGPLFVAPLLATSLGEFWGKRWNLAFSEMAATLVYRPLARRAGPGLALLAAFLFSGLLHEMAISLPAKGGYGGPLVYFLLHGALVAAERWLGKRGVRIEGWKGRVWTLAWLALPLPLLFHPPGLEALVWPLLGLA